MKLPNRSVLALAALSALIGAAGCDSTALGLGPDGASRFIAIGAEGAIVRSLDGAKWTRASSGVSVNLTSIATGRSIFVAVGAGGTILTSSDGASWTDRASQTTIDLAHVIFTGEQFVAVGGSWDSGAVTLKSADGRSWTQVQSPSGHMFHAVAHGGGGTPLLAAAYSLSALQLPSVFSTTISTGSSDASGWTQAQGPDFYDSVTVGPDILVVGEGTVFTTRDGGEWVARPLPVEAGVHGITAGREGFVVVGELGAVYSSADGTDWLQRVTALGKDELRGVTWGDSKYVAVGGGGTILTSPEGVVWSTQVGGTTKHLFDVAYGPVAP